MSCWAFLATETRQPAPASRDSALRLLRPAPSGASESASPPGAEERDPPPALGRQRRDPTALPLPRASLTSLEAAVEVNGEHDGRTHVAELAPAPGRGDVELDAPAPAPDRIIRTLTPASIRTPVAAPDRTPAAAPDRIARRPTPAARYRSSSAGVRGRRPTRSSAEKLRSLMGSFAELQAQGLAKAAGMKKSMLGTGMKLASAAAPPARTLSRSMLMAPRSMLGAGLKLASAAWTTTTCSQAPRLPANAPRAVPKDELDAAAALRDDDGSTCSGGSRASSSGVSADDIVPAQIVDGVLVRQPEDGSCLFHSLAYGLDDRTSSAALRCQITEFMKEKPLLKISSTTIQDWMRMEADKTPLAYTRELARRGTWGGALEIAVAARVKGVNIHVYERLGDRYRCITTFTEPHASKTVSIVYRTTPSRHYDALCVMLPPSPERQRGLSHRR